MKTYIDIPTIEFTEFEDINMYPINFWTENEIKAFKPKLLVFLEVYYD